MKVNSWKIDICSQIIRKGCPSIGPLKSECERVVSDTSDMSELLADALSGVIVEDAPPVCVQHQNFADVLDEVHVSPESVSRALSSLNSPSATDSDGLHPHLLKACFAAVSLPFYLLFVRFLEEEVLPSLWKTSIAAPLYKIARDMTNWIIVLRISHLAMWCKVLKRVIVSQLVDYLESNGLVSVNSFGFHKKKCWGSVAGDMCWGDWIRW